MDTLPSEVLHLICRLMGYKATLQLCRVNSVLNERISNDIFLWSQFADDIFSRNGDRRYTRNGVGCTKARFLYLLCFHLYLLKDIVEGTSHKCRK